MGKNLEAGHWGKQHHRNQFGHVESEMSSRNALRLAVGYRVQGRRNIPIGEMDLGGDSIYMMFRVFSRDEVTKGLRAIEEKETGPNPGLLRAKQADQSAHPECTAQSGSVSRRHRDQGDPAFSGHRNFLDCENLDSLG